MSDTYLVAKKYLFFVQQPYSYAILRPIQEAVFKSGGQVCWFLNGRAVNPNQLRENEVRLSTVKDVINWNADAVIVPGNVVPDFFPGVKVQIFHGLEWKKKGHFSIKGFFDLYCTHGPITTAKFKDLQRKFKYFDVVETGWPKLDPYLSVSNTRVDCAKKIVLYAPTFSPSLTSAPELLQFWTDVIADHDCLVLIKFHPKMAENVVDMYRELARSVDSIIIDDSDSLMPLILKSDVVVSDTSSAVAESLILGKPVVTYRNSLPEEALINFTNPADLSVMIARGLATSSERERILSSYIDELHPYRDGKSSERIIEAIDGVIKKGLKKKPLNIFRKYKVRKSLGLRFWWF